MKKTTAEQLRKYLMGYADTLSEIAGDYEALAEYLEETYDVEFRVDARKQYRGVVIMLAGGGLNIYLDTRAGVIRGYWGFTREEWEISRATANAVDDYFEELWSDIAES